MRVAWIYSGLPRQAEKGFKRLAPYINAYDSTVAAHLWETDEGGKPDYNIRTNKYNKLPRRQYADDISDFKKLLPNAKVLTEPCSTALIPFPANAEEYKAKITQDMKHHLFHLATYSCTSDVRSYYGLLSLQKSFNLLDNPEQFDMIVKLRTDLILLEIYTPIPIPYQIDAFNTLGILGADNKVNDLIYYGNPNVMKTMSTMVDNYWDLAVQCQSFSIHYMLPAHCANNSIPIATAGFKLFCTDDMVLR